VGYLVKTD
jgi:CheY-like chemotaxis protein